MSALRHAAHVQGLTEKAICIPEGLGSSQDPSGMFPESAHMIVRLAGTADHEFYRAPDMSGSTTA